MGLDYRGLKKYFSQGKYIFLYNILERLTFFAFYISIARYIDKELYGLIVSVSAFTNILASLFDLGFPFFVQRESATGNIERQSLTNIFLFKLILIFALLPLPLIYFNNESKFFIIILLITLVNFYQSLNQILVFYLNGKDKFLINFYSVFYTRIVLFILLIIFTIFKIHVEISLLTLLIILILQSVYLSKFVEGLQLINILGIFNINHTISIIKKSLHFGLGVIFTMAYDRIDVLILKHFWGNIDVAVYSVAYSLFRHTSVFSTVVLLQSYNKLSRIFWEQSRISLKMIYQDVVILMVVALGLVLIYSSWGDSIITIVYTDKFLVSSPYLKTISLAIPLIFLNNFTSIWLNSLRLERFTMLTALLGLLINIVSNFILIPKLKIYGAVYSTIITEGTILLFQLFLIIKISIKHR